MIPAPLLDEFKGLSSEQLRVLAKQLLYEAKRREQQENRLQAVAFKRGDIVTFDLKGHQHLAVIMKVNAHKISLITPEGARWQIEPKQLTLEPHPSEETITLFERLLGPLSQRFPQ